MTLKKRRIIFGFCVFTFLILAFVILFYSQGYILDKNLVLSRRGGLYVSTPLSGSEIFVNHKKEETTGMLNSGLFMSNLKVGEYSILVAKEGFWPWAKTLEVKEGLVTEVRAFMVPENPQGEMLLRGKFLNIWSSPQNKILMLQEPKNGSNYLTFYIPEEKTFLTAGSQFTERLLTFEDKISNLIWEEDCLIFKKDANYVKASFNLTERAVSAKYINTKTKEVSDFERLTKNGDGKVWWNQGTNEVFIGWLNKNSPPPYYMCDTKNCQLPTRIFQSRLAVKNVDFFPGRKDVIIIAVGIGVYALEIDGRDGRLIYPIYKGKEPNFALVEDEIYIVDDGSLIKIYLVE